MAREPMGDAEIAAFLARVGKADLWSYYGVSPDASPEVIDAAVKKRRAWAQGQQANPKFREEAMFLIKQNSLLRARLVPGAAVEAPVAAPPPPPDPVTNPWAVLGVPPEATLEAMAIAYRDRQRYLRVTGTNADLAALDVAWRRIHELAAAPAPEPAATTSPPAGDAPLTVRPTEIDNTTRVFVIPERSGTGAPDAVEARPAAHAFAAGDAPSSGEAGRSPASEPAGDRHTAPAPTRPTPTRAIPRLDPLSEVRTVATPPPRLVVDCPPRVEVELGESPHRFRLVVRNAGGGRMPGRIVADKPWVELSNAHLDADFSTQARTVTLHASRLVHAKETAVLSVVTDHGERVDVTIEARRGPMTHWPMVAGFSVLALLVFLGAFWLTFRHSASDDLRVEVLVEPPADNVYVDGRWVGSGATVVAVVARGQQHRLRVEAAGYGTYDEHVQSVEGDSLTRRIRLIPRPDAPAVDLAAYQEALSGPMVRCFAAVGATGVVQVALTVERGVASVTGLSPALAAAEPCVLQAVASASPGLASVPDFEHLFHLPMPEPPP